MKTIRTIFEGTKDAMQYGESIRGNQEAIDKMKNAYGQIVNAYTTLDSIGGIDAQFLINLAFRAQFVREAFMHAEGNLIKDTGGNKGGE